MLTSSEIEAHICAYMDSCTTGDPSVTATYFEHDAVQYFPDGMYGGPFRGAQAIAERFAEAVRTGGSAWTVDAVAVDEVRQQAAVEWTHFKQRSGIVLRGCEWYVYWSRGLIQEILGTGLKR